MHHTTSRGVVASRRAHFRVRRSGVEPGTPVSQTKTPKTLSHPPSRQSISIKRFQCETLRRLMLTHCNLICDSTCQYIDALVSCRPSWIAITYGFLLVFLVMAFNVILEELFNASLRSMLNIFKMLRSLLFVGR